MEYVKIEIL